MTITNYNVPGVARGYTDAIWKLSQWDEYVRGDISVGWGIDEDFLTLPTGKYTATQASAGTAVLNDAAGGTILVDCNSTTVEQGINVQLNTSVGEIFKPVAGYNIYFECRFRVGDLTAGSTGPEFFMGLAAIDTAIIGSSALDQNDYIGWQSITDDGVLLWQSNKVGTAATGKTGLSLATAATYDVALWHKLGFIVKGVTSIEQYVDGVYSSGTNQVTANIPIVEMVPSFVCQSDGTVDTIVEIDHYRVFQGKA